jgi:hypothetical protein
LALRDTLIKHTGLTKGSSFYNKVVNSGVDIPGFVGNVYVVSKTFAIAVAKVFFMFQNLM